MKEKSQTITSMSKNFRVNRKPFIIFRTSFLILIILFAVFSIQNPSIATATSNDVRTEKFLETEQQTKTAQTGKNTKTPTQNDSMPNISSTTTPTPTEVIEGVFSSAEKSFGETLGVFLGILGISFVLLVFGLLVRLYRYLLVRKPILTLGSMNITSTSVDNTELQIVQQFKNTFADLCACSNFLENCIAFDVEKLRVFGLYKLLPDVISNPDKVSIKLSVGPFELSGVENFINKLIAKRDFNLLISCQTKKEGEKKSKLIISLRNRNEVLYSDIIETDDEGILKSILQVACKVSWAISQKQIRNIEQLNLKTPPDVDCILGMYYLNKYLQELSGVSLLSEAIEHFHLASNYNDEWMFQAGLLEAITLQLTQNYPQITVSKIEEILCKIKLSQFRNQIVTYNLGQSLFYTYSRYDEAIEKFNQLKKPECFWFLLLLSRVLPLRKKSMQYRLYCLSQAGIAITKAHQISSHKSEDENKRLEKEIQVIVKKMKKEVAQYKFYLGAAANEIVWRLDNVEIMISVKMKKKINEAITLAEEVSHSVPYALDVKANLGSLFLLAALQNSDHSQDISKSAEFLKSDEVFTNLQSMGWGPGFVKYRLGMIRRVQQRYPEAEKLLKEALEINVVPQASIQYQLDKIHKKDNTFSLEDA